MSRLDPLIHFGRKVKLFMMKGPTYHYTYGRWRFRRWLSHRLSEVARLDDQAFFAQLHLEKPELNQVKKAVTEGNYENAKGRLLTYFQTRNTPRFFFEAADINEHLSLIDVMDKQAAIDEAHQVCQNIFHFRRMPPVKFEDRIDWTYCPDGNTDWTWDLNRHAYFETLGRAYWYTGDERYARKFRTLLLDWLAKNPANVSQPNWSSVFEVAFRINTWIWAYYFFHTSMGFDQETHLAFLKGLLTHGRYLDANLELHAQNNHLLLEAKSLAMLGLLFPEFKIAEKWRQRGLNILYEQIRAQVCADGVHGELSTHYHRVIAGELLELLVLLENNNVAPPSDITELFSRMIEFELWVTKPNNLIPLLGDSALKDVHLRFSALSGGAVFLKRYDLKTVVPELDETNLWLLGPKRVKQYSDSSEEAICLRSRAFPEGGYFIMRSGQGVETSYLNFDCGPFGYRLDPNHGHADALSFELYALGQTWLVDSGVYSTHLGWEWRRFFRGTRSHNTVIVDNQDQSILLDSRRVYRPAQATLHQWTSNDQFDFVDGSHDGYERLTKPITHRRQIFFVKPEYWIIIDILTGQGQHCFDLHFHLMPDIDIQLDPESGSLHLANGASGLSIIPLATNELQTDIITGKTEPIQGWVSFFSGEKLAAPTLRYRRQAMAPIQFCTVLYPYPAAENVLINVSALDLTVEGKPSIDESQLTGLCIETSRHIDYLLLDRNPESSRKFFAGYETDAHLFYLRHQKGEELPAKVLMKSSSQLLFQGQSLSNR